MRLRSLLVMVPLVGAFAACGGETDPAGVIPRETFVATWLDLRAAAKATGDPLAEEERVRVLGEHGVTEEQLLGFVEAHGDDPGFMAEVWTEIETRARPAPAPDTAVVP